MLIIICGILFSYMHVAALATTDILRLLRGSTIGVFHSKCYCSECNHTISLLHQFPIFAYIINRGKCPYCKKKIEPLNFYLEVSLFTMYLVIMLVFGFKPIGVLVTFCAYEIIKIGFIIVKGHKEKNFYKEYILSILTNTIVFSLVGFMSILYNFVSSGNILR